jgi:hypothetical protein
MENFNIYEYNQLCAEFLELPYDIETWESPTYQFGIYDFELGELQFHSNWEFIMTVISKIKEIEKDYPITTEEVLSTFIFESKDNIVRKIYDFLIKYNEITFKKSPYQIGTKIIDSESIRPLAHYQGNIFIKTEKGWRPYNFPDKNLKGDINENDIGVGKRFYVI